MNLGWLQRWIVRQLLTAYVDGELPAREADAIERILAQDKHLAQEYRDLRALDSILRESVPEAHPIVRPLQEQQGIRMTTPRSRRWSWLAEWYEDLARDPIVACGTAIIGIIGAGLVLISG